jgi:hypothetical protein
MSKLKAFLIEMQQVRKEKGQIMKYLDTGFDSEYYGRLEYCNFSTNSRYYAAMQLLICDTDAIINFDDKAHKDAEGYYHKTIASHPTIPNTAPLSEEFIREYVACQGECEVEYSTVQVCSVCGKLPGVLCESQCLGMPLVDTPLVDVQCNPILRIVPRTTVIDEETGENVMTHNVWTDEDMQAAWNAKEQLYKVTDTPDFHTWLSDRKKDNK